MKNVVVKLKTKTINEKTANIEVEKGEHTILLEARFSFGKVVVGNWTEQSTTYSNMVVCACALYLAQWTHKRHHVIIFIKFSLVQNFHLTQLNEEIIITPQKLR